jgi:hypothetical protein
MQGKQQWGEGTDHFLMDFAGRTGALSNCASFLSFPFFLSLFVCLQYFLTFLLV